MPGRGFGLRYSAFFRVSALGIRIWAAGDGWYCPVTQARCERGRYAPARLCTPSHLTCSFSHEVTGSGAMPTSGMCPSGESGTPPRCRTSPAPLPGGRRPKKPSATSGYRLATLRVDCPRMSKLLRMVETLSTAAPCLQHARDAGEYVPTRFRAAKRVRMSGVLSPIRVSSGFTMYRCTKLVTCTGFSVFAIGYVFSALLAQPRVANSRGLRPLRTEYRGLPACSRPAF
jgi:hypothetical protein